MSCRFSWLVPVLLFACALSRGGERTVDLLALVKPDVHSVVGRWKMEDGALTLDNNRDCARVALPYLPPDEYDFRIVYKLVEGDETVAQILARQRNDFVCEWVDDGSVGISVTQGKFARSDANPTFRRSATRPPPSERREAVVKVRNDNISLWLDGRRVLSYPTDYSDFTPHLYWRLPMPTLGVGCWQARAAFYEITVTEIDKPGILLPDDAFHREHRRNSVNLRKAPKIDQEQ